MRTTIAGDIRRIRLNILKPNGNGMVEADYGELHKVLDEIEAKEKHYKSLVKELADELDSLTCHSNCDVSHNDLCDDECFHLKNRALVARAREVAK